MDLVKDAFIILYFLATTDGNIDPRETLIIADFIKRQHGQLNFIPSQTILDLETLKGDRRIDEYDRALFSFKNGSSVQDRLTMLTFAADLTAADGVITEGEKVLFQDMAKVWGIDLQKFFQQAGVAVSPSALPFAAPLPQHKPVETFCEPIQTLMAYSQQRAGVNEVLRSLVSHRGWFAPLVMFITEGKQDINVDHLLMFSTEVYMKAGDLWLFTDRASALRAQAINAPIGSYSGVMSGTELFGKIPADIKNIHINPCSPLEQRWSFMDGTSIELARLWSEVIVLEEKIGQWQYLGKPDLKALADYRGFITITNASNEIFLIKEIDPTMPIAAAIFTSPDSAQLFLSKLPPEQSATLKQITINGETLLNDLPAMQIRRQNNLPPLSLDGAVINANGPGTFYMLRFSDIQ